MRACVSVIVGLVLSVLVVLPVHAITQQELQEAYVILNRMDDTIGRLQNYVLIALEGKTQEITLTPGQRQTLKDRYLAEKGDLVTLFNQLP